MILLVTDCIEEYIFGGLVGASITTALWVTLLTLWRNS
jgi:hypothetical protein